MLYCILYWITLHYIIAARAADQRPGARAQERRRHAGGPDSCVQFRTMLDVSKPRYGGAPNLNEDIY